MELDLARFFDYQKIFCTMCTLNFWLQDAYEIPGSVGKVFLYRPGQVVRNICLFGIVVFEIDNACTFSSKLASTEMASIAKMGFLSVDDSGNRFSSFSFIASWAWICNCNLT